MYISTLDSVIEITSIYTNGLSKTQSHLMLVCCDKHTQTIQLSEKKEQHMRRQSGKKEVSMSIAISNVQVAFVYTCIVEAANPRTFR